MIHVRLRNKEKIPKTSMNRISKHLIGYRYVIKSRRWSLLSTVVHDIGLPSEHAFMRLCKSAKRCSTIGNHAGQVSPRHWQSHPSVLGNQSFQNIFQGWKLNPAVLGNLGAAMVTMDVTVGYLNRKNNPPPSYQQIWDGYTRLVNMSQAYELVIGTSKDGWLYEKLISDWICV